jgi:CHAD domain-containing protein
MDDAEPGPVEPEGSTGREAPPTVTGDLALIQGGAAVPFPADAGLAAERLAAAHLADARTPGLRADDSWAEAGRSVLRFHLARMLARVPGVVAGEDPEDVHAMRVAARRMRAAWRVFGDGFERDARRRYLAELRDIGARLGDVRDLDVLIEIVVTYGNQRSARQRAGLQPLLAAWRARREARRVDLVAALGSERFVEFTRDYGAFAEAPGLAARAVGPHAPGLVRNRMPATIWAAYQDVWAFDGDLATADLATLHELRIAAKWLRYTLEFVREPLEPQATGRSGQVVALQDHLGDQHDQHVAGLLAREHATSATLTSLQARSVAKLVDHLDQGVERLSRTVGSTWRPIAAPSYRRGLGRAVARL